MNNESTCQHGTPLYGATCPHCAKDELHKLKYFTREKTNVCYGEIGLLLDQVFSMRKLENNNVIFTEECDGYFKKELTADQAIEMLEEAIYAIKNDLV